MAEWTKWLDVRDQGVARSGFVLAILLALVIGLVLGLARIGLVSLEFIGDNWTFLLNPALLSLTVTVVSYIIGFTAAIPLGLVRAFGPGIILNGRARGRLMMPLYGFVTGYVEAIRGTPVLVQIFLVANVATLTFQGIPNIPLIAGVVALTINTAGYQAEVFRAGFQSVGQTQIEAAKSIGMRPFQVFANVTLPQCLRLVTLPLVNEWIGLFKASALLGLVAVQELNWGAGYLGNNRSHPIEAFLMVSIFYLAIILPVTRAVNFIELKRRIPGLGATQTERQTRRVPAPAVGSRPA